MEEKNADWAISSQALNRGRFNDYPESGSRNFGSDAGSPKPPMGGMVKI